MTAPIVDPDEANAAIPVSEGEKWLLATPFIRYPISQPPPPEAKPGLAFRTARQIAEATPERPDWVHEGTLVRGSITEVDGKAKLAGKSTYIGHKVRAILAGVPFLGKATAQGPVIWLTEENDPSFRQTLERCHLTTADDLHVLRYIDTIGTDWPEVVASARQKAKEAAAVLLVIDTLPRFAGLHGDEENSSGGALEAMDPVLFAAGDGLAVLVARHDRRAGGETGESGRGSTAFTGSVDIVLHLSRIGGNGRANVRQLDGIGRFSEIPEKLMLELCPDGYRSLGSEADLQRQEARDLLLEHLPEEEEDAITLPSLWAPARQASDRNPAREAGPLAETKLSKNTFYRAAEELLEAGNVRKREISARRTVWSLCPTPRGPLGYTDKQGSSVAAGRDVSHGPIPIDGTHGIHTGPPGGLAGSQKVLEFPVCPSCGRSDYQSLGDGEYCCRDCGTEWEP